MSNYNKISQVELIRFYWEKIKDKTLTNEASFERLHQLIENVKRKSSITPRIVKLIEQEMKWKRKK
jgi:hypothetical protein